MVMPPPRDERSAATCRFANLDPGQELSATSPKLKVAPLDVFLKVTPSDMNTEKG
jgi:hypothetical protein